MAIKYRIYIIFHDKLNVQYYNKSILCNFIFVNVREGNKNRYPELNIINLHELRNFISIGSYYAESEVLYNIYRNTYLIEDVDFVGFLHHDIDCSPLTEEILQNLILNSKMISFETHCFKRDYDQNILMDPLKVNTLTGIGKNCYDEIFHDYNSTYNTLHSLGKFYQLNIEIVLCSCFLIQKDIFLNLMEFSSSIIESKKLNVFDTNHKHRIQGGFMERYYAVWFMLKGIPFISFKLKHNFHETEKQKSLYHKIVRKFKSLILNKNGYK